MTFTLIYAEWSTELVVGRSSVRALNIHKHCTLDSYHKYYQDWLADFLWKLLGIWEYDTLRGGRSSSLSKVTLWHLLQENNDATASQVRELGGKAHSYTCDVSKSADIHSVAQKVRQDVGEVDVLINNAGILYGGALLDMEERHIRRTFEVNTLAHFWVKSWCEWMMTGQEDLINPVLDTWCVLHCRLHCNVRLYVPSCDVWLVTAYHVLFVLLQIVKGVGFIANFIVCLTYYGQWCDIWPYKCLFCCRIQFIV